MTVGDLRAPNPGDKEKGMRRSLSRVRPTRLTWLLAAALVFASLVLVTEDHNLAHERHRRGELSLDEAQRLPSANVLTKAIGISKHLRLQTHIDEVEASDRYLISTDGLYKEFTFESLQQRLSGQFDDQILETLIDDALNQGGKDNITGVVVDVGE